MMNGKTMRWKDPVHINFAGNPIGQSGVSPLEFFDSAVRSLQRWQTASHQTIHFDYWQGTDKAIYPTTGGHEGLSTLFYLSNADSPIHLAPNVLGITELWYQTQTGIIEEADIILNDRDFFFTIRPEDTSGSGGRPAQFTGDKMNVYIQNVMTHELGHAFGLSHTGMLQSTMLFMEAPEQAHLGCDDQIAISTLYPGIEPFHSGKLTGKIITETGDPVFGAQVVAISLERGTALSTAMTDHLGQYSFPHLEPDSYVLMAEPFFGGPEVLPTFYAELTLDTCPGGSSWSRTFLTGSDPFQLTQNAVRLHTETTAPTLTVRCKNSIRSSPAFLALDLSQENPKRLGIVDQLEPFSSKTYRLDRFAGTLRIHALSYSLYAPIRSHLLLTDLKGRPIPTSLQDPIYQGESGFTDYDTALTAENLAFGSYLLTVSAERLDINNYPAGSTSLDKVSFFILLGSGQPSGINTHGEDLPHHPRCQRTEEFSTYRSPAGPPRHTTPSLPPDSPPIGSCGTTQHKRSSEQAPPLSILGWLLPWMIILTESRFLIFLHRRMSTIKLKE
jgi:hypothetical protein